MSFSLNRITLIGNLGKDSETRFTQNNTSVTNFSIATTHSYKGSDGNWVESTTWHNIIAWSLSDFYKDALKKGKKIYVEGRLSKRDYTDKEGVKKYVTEVVSEKIIPLDRIENQTSGNYSAPETESNDGGMNDELPF